MNRRPNRVPNKSLPTLRGMLGQTQTQFAALIGVSLPLIKAIECGQRPLSEKLERKIMIATGASLGQWTVSRDRQGKSKFRPFRDGRVNSIWFSRPSEGTKIILDADMPSSANSASGPFSKKWIQQTEVIASKTGDKKRKVRDGSSSEKKEMGWFIACPHHGKPGKPESDTTLPYDKQLFEAHLRLLNSPGAAEQRFETLAPKLKALFVAAAKPSVAGVKHRLPALEMSFLDWMAEANQEFKLAVNLYE